MEEMCLFFFYNKICLYLSFLHLTEINIFFNVNFLFNVKK